MTPTRPPTTHDGPLRERRDVLELLAAEAERARTGSGRMTVLRGATGIGRSAVLEAVADDGAAHGMRVLRARCSAEDTGTDLATVRQLLGYDADCRPEDRPGFGRFWRLLRSAAADSPILLAVDDAHLADHLSRRWLAEAARRLDELAVLIVVTERSQYDITPPAPGLAHALSPTLVHVHTLAPLSCTAAETMVRDRFGPHAPDAWVDGCVQACAGNPLLLRALLDDLGSPTRDGHAAAGFPDNCADLYPGAFAAAVAWWLESAGPGTAAVARALAQLVGGQLAYGQPAEGQMADGQSAYEEDGVELLAGVTGADPARVSGWVTAMQRLGLLRPRHLRDDPGPGRIRFAHPLLRDAVLDGWPRPQRQEAHHRAAAFLYRRGGTAEAVAGHLLQTPLVGTEWAVDALQDAAATAARDGRAGDAVDHLRRALDEPMARDRRAEVLTELGSLEFTAVRSSGIPRLTEALRLRELPRERVQATVTLCSALAQRGEAHAAFDLLHDLDLDGGLADEPLLARTVRTASVLLSDHDPEVRLTVYAGLRDTAARSPALLGPAEQALLVRYEATVGLLTADQAMRRIRALLSAPEDPTLTPYLIGTAAAVAQWSDALDDADRLVRFGLAGPGLSPLHPMRRALLNVQLDTAAARGRFAPVPAGLGADGVPADLAAPDGPSNLRAHSLHALVESGRLADAQRLAGQVDVQDAHDSWELNRFLYARGMLRSASGDVEGALDDFLECGRRQTARQVLSPIVTPWRSAAAECLLALGSPQRALPLAEEEYRLATAWNTPRVLGRALRVLGEASSGRRGHELTAQAVEILRGTSEGSELTAALISRGRKLTAAGQRGEARSLLREATATAERLGAVRLLTLAEQALGEGGARRRTARATGVGALTESEHRIAGLAAAGRTNAEIAYLQHLARRTVETHLTSTYRKLGIRRRSELPAALDPDPSEVPHGRVCRYEPPPLDGPKNSISAMATCFKAEAP
ncbi:AAA family ATPase [Streptacidiphilus carbonis]|uniref:AAA family ATPase n=1 Tax=Streptacidiphilus carbonis TaxID=105422 RepID=UPI0007C6A0A9|nr:AAA family ATPase [Streptacidiphilus carbonis]